MPKPITIVNFKAYKRGVGGNAVKLAKICERVAKQTRMPIAVAVQAIDIATVARAVSIPVFAQHVDPIEQGAHTGAVLPAGVKAAGGKGTLINHSEKQVPTRVIKQTLRLCKKNKLTTVLCAGTPRRALELAKLKPDFVAIEPPELIGGPVSVSRAKPRVITATTKRTKLPVICGAGIRTQEDVAKAAELGVKGILVTSGVVKARNPAQALRNLIAGF